MRTVFVHEQKIIPPVMISASAILAQAKKAQYSVLHVLDHLYPSPDFWVKWYEQGMNRFGRGWGYVDLLGVLGVAADWLNAKTYLEVGSASGRSASIVGSASEKCAITAIDLWPAGNQQLVADNLRRVNHTGPVKLIRGNSHEELPKLRGEKFQLILVDGDHTKQGAVQDLKDVLPLLPVGGILVFDDLCVPGLNEAWHEVIDRRFSTAGYRESGAGVAVAVKRRP